MLNVLENLLFEEGPYKTNPYRKGMDVLGYNVVVSTCVGQYQYSWTNGQ